MADWLNSLPTYNFNINSVLIAQKKSSSLLSRIESKIKPKSVNDFIPENSHYDDDELSNTNNNESDNQTSIYKNFENICKTVTEDLEKLGEQLQNQRTINSQACSQKCTKLNSKQSSSKVLLIGKTQGRSSTEVFSSRGSTGTLKNETSLSSLTSSSNGRKKTSANTHATLLSHSIITSPKSNTKILQKHPSRFSELSDAQTFASYDLSEAGSGHHSGQMSSSNFVVSSCRSPFKTPERPSQKLFKRSSVTTSFSDSVSELHKNLEVGLWKYPIKDVIQEINFNKNESEKKGPLPTGKTKKGKEDHYTTTDHKTPTTSPEKIPANSYLRAYHESFDSPQTHKNRLEKSPDTKVHPADVNATPHKIQRRYQRLNEQFIKFETHSMYSSVPIQTAKDFRTPMSPAATKNSSSFNNYNNNLLPTSSAHSDKMTLTKQNLNFAFGSSSMGLKTLAASRRMGRRGSQM